MHRPGGRACAGREKNWFGSFLLEKVYVVVKKNMRKHNRKPPPGVFELGEDLLLSFRMCVFIKRGKACHSRRALSIEG